MYQNGDPENWFVEIRGQVSQPGSVGDAAERLINATISEVAEDQSSLIDSGIELKLLVEAMRSIIENWYQIQSIRG